MDTGHWSQQSLNRLLAQSDVQHSFRNTSSIFSLKPAEELLPELGFAVALCCIRRRRIVRTVQKSFPICSRCYKKKDRPRATLAFHSCWKIGLPLWRPTQNGIFVGLGRRVMKYCYQGKNGSALVHSCPSTHTFSLCQLLKV